MVLDATTLLTQEEVHFLESVLLPEGFRNIFFLINKWNLVEQSVLRPEDVEREFAGLESRIRDRLFPFCMIDRRDRSAERIFRVNALGALKGRMRKPQSAAMLEESNLPAFEASLQRFLVEDRGKARTDLILAAVKTTCDEINRFIATQMTLAGKSIAEIEAEQVALKPKLDRLRGIRQHIVGFLDTQAANLQDRLVISFQNQITKIDGELLAAVESFDLSEITKGSMVWTSLTDWAREDKNKFAKKIERCVKPQVQRMLEHRLLEWRESVVKNEMKAVMIDVDKHLQEEAAEYQRVMREIEERIGIHGSPLQVKELVERWLGQDDIGGSGKFELSGVGVLGDLSWLVGGIALDVVAEVFTHMTFVWIPIVGLMITAARLLWREANLRKQIREKIVQAIREGLAKASQTEAAKIRAKVKEGFNGLKGKIAGNIDEEIAIIEASLQSIVDRKKEREYSVENEKLRLEAAHAAIGATVERVHATLRSH